MILRIINSFWSKVLAAFMVLNLMAEIIFPTMSLALTSGPVSIDQASFEPAATSEMVDLATGDFTYNIPLLDVDGYPINLAYHGGVDMEQESSMVGLGWTLNVGAINRSMRGLPDDFNGDEITTEMNLRPNYTVGGQLDVSGEFAGFEDIEFSKGVVSTNFGATIGIGVSFNNYVGFSTELTTGFSANLSFSLLNKGKTNNTSTTDDDEPGLASIGLSGSRTSNSRDGVTTSLGAGFSMLGGQIGIGVGFAFNTNEGLVAKNVSTSTPLSSNVGSFPVATTSYVPSIMLETNTKSLNFCVGLGGEFNSFYGHVNGTFFQSLTCNKLDTEVVPSYGYNFLQNTPTDNYLMDFNREGVILANENIKYLPITNQTYDLFSATAQGVGFSFRSHRSDVGMIGDMNRSHDINGVGVSGEAGFGNLWQAGINVDIPYGYSSSGKWNSNNQANSSIKYVNTAPSGSGIDQKLYETYYFKKFGNRSTIDETFYDEMMGTSAIRQQIIKTGLDHTGTNAFLDKNGSTVYNATDLDHFKAGRDSRNTDIEYLNGREASSYSHSHLIENYSLSDYTYTGGDYDFTTSNRYGTLSDEAKAHHLSEMTVLEGDGSRYVYGLPVINHLTKEVTFNVSDESSNSGPALTRDCKNGLVEYTGGTENSMDNRRGDNNLFLRKTVPAYSSSYLLTAYLSSNYIDRTLNGPTPDDFGSYTKFNYAKTGTTKWRFPFDEETAGYNEGLKADPYDDLASYVYGERDQWYLHSIESKNFVAEFHYGNRHDGYGVEDEDGGINSTTNYSRRLIKIELHARQGKMNSQPPIKTVHFEYDYSLCQLVPNNDNQAATSEVGVSNNQGGKLTLKAIYFTYGNSNRGKLHKYRFDYSSENPNYRIGAVDRWGSYKDIDGSATCDETGTLSNIEFPYAEQNKTEADLNASAWMLETIHLPSGSDIHVEVESDDYGFVQNYPVTKMYNIRGFSQTSTFDDGSKQVLFSNNETPYNYLHVQVDNLGNSSSDAKVNFFNNYLTTNELYFRVLVKVSPEAILPNYSYVEDQYEYISGYAEVDQVQTIVYDQGSDGSFETVAIKLKDVSLKDEDKSSSTTKKTNPISKASWQFTRKYLPKIINPIVGDIYQHDASITCDADYEVPEYPEDDEIEVPDDVKEKNKILKDIVNTAKSHLQNIISNGGINFMLASMKYSSACVVNKSWVRLGMGNNAKLGGGHRVKQITVNDNWDDVKSNESESTYGSTYAYTTAESGHTKTSGVASYEPLGSGGDENPMRKPLHYNIDVKMRVDDAEFQEFPYGESIFASSNVAYSEVTVKNISYDNVTQNSTGQTVHEFYTAKDFPVKFDYTGGADVSKLKDESNGWTSLFSGESFNYLSMSQGYAIHLNDMHGKFKRKTVYGAQISPSIPPPIIYLMEHNYYIDENNPEVLNNIVPTVDPSGTISNRIIGRDIDMVVDVNQAKSVYGTQTYQAGIDVFYFFILIPLPSVWYRDISIENRYRSSVTTKVITSTGILKEVVLVDKGRYKTSKNLLFDANTGVPVVTEINHEIPSGTGYEKPIYQYDYPAYWFYEGMGLASENWGAKFNSDLVTNVSGHYKVTIANKEVYLNPGDELSVYNTSLGSYEEKVWVIEDESNGDYYLVDADGLTPSYTIANVNYKVIRSGKRNLLGSTAASVTSLTKFTTSPYADGFAHSQVLNASAVEYTDRAYGYTSSNGTYPTSLCGINAGNTVNPYMNGLRGNWNLLSSYVYDYTRDQTTGNSRIDGVLTDYIEFWENNSGVWEKNTDVLIADRWIRAAVATIFDREGFNLESQDALGIYSSILLGYNHTLKTAEAVNARYYEIGFDGFEDRNYDLPDDCTTPHFRLTGASVNNTVAHTGRHSASISFGEMAFITSDVKTTIDHNVTDHTKPYVVQAAELIKKYTYLASADAPKKYVLTLWAKEGIKLPTVTDYANLDIVVKYNNVALTNLEEHRTNIIDGWQRIEVIFELPALPSPLGTENCKIELHNNSQTPLFIDDVRLQPFNSEMVSYVIDPISLRLWATLDSRNFATFYQYDEEGSLVRILQETERGKITVQENRAGIRISN